jgi:hypothetical protein
MKKASLGMLFLFCQGKKTQIHYTKFTNLSAARQGKTQNFTENFLVPYNHPTAAIHFNSIAIGVGKAFTSTVVRQG